MREHRPRGLDPAAAVRRRRSRVLVAERSRHPGLEQDAAQLLRDAGYVFVNGGNANRFGYDKTVVIIPDARRRRRRSGDVGGRRARGPGQRGAGSAPTGQHVADVIVILGRRLRRP